MKLLITGSRKLTYEQTEKMINRGLIELFSNKSFRLDTILHGGAIGSDSHVETWAKENEYPTEVVLPDYDKYPGHVAPLVRNTELVKRADLTLAMYAFSEWRQGGTGDAAKKTRQAGKVLVELMADWDDVLFTPEKYRQGSLFG